ncbi:MAG: response regulator [Candidatus Omnitrophota bacterium]
MTDAKADVKDYPREIDELKHRVLLLETENKHLTNELRLAGDEREAARRDYFHIIFNMEQIVARRTRETKELQKLSEARSKELQVIIDTAPYMIFYKDIHMRYIRVNQELAKMFGLPIDKIIGKTFNELFPDSPDILMNYDNEVIESGNAVTNVETYMETRAGKRCIQIDKVPLKDIDGNISGIIGFAIDVTELKRAEKEKQELKEKINQMEKMEAIGRLAGGVAHDLNNVLSAVVSYPDIILMRLPEDSSFRKPILTMQKSGQKAAAIVEDLLTLARRGVPVNEVVNLNDIIKIYLDSPEFDTLRAYNPQVTVETRLDPDLLNIIGSPIHLTKTIMNLISNAAEATLHKGAILLSTTNTYLDRHHQSPELNMPEGEYVVLKVVDNGMGIKPEDLKKIFEPFYTKKAMGRSGTGLGMAVVWGTVKDHKGHINVASVEGVGSTFELFFPITREVCEREKKVVPIRQYTGDRERVLVVDDVLEQREISTMLLTSLNYVVETVSSGEAALEYLKNHDVDLVVLDMIMDPGIDGMMTYKRISEIRPGQRAIITSGYSETHRVREAQRLGAGQYVKKPYTLEKLGLAIRAELDKKR